LVWEASNASSRFPACRGVDGRGRADARTAARKGRLKQCVTRGVFAHDMSFEDTCRTAARLGLKGYDLEGPEQWPMLKKYGLTPTMWPPGPGGTISNALNRNENHAPLEKAMHQALDDAAANGVPASSL